jgi:hypothetical protein
MDNNEVLSVIGAITFVIVCIVALIVGLWIIWVVAGIAVLYIGFDGGHPVIMQMFFTMVIIAILGMIGRIGQK